MFWIVILRTWSRFFTYTYISRETSQKIRFSYGTLCAIVQLWIHCHLSACSLPLVPSAKDCLFKLFSLPPGRNTGTGKCSQKNYWCRFFHFKTSKINSFSWYPFSLHRRLQYRSLAERAYRSTDGDRYNLFWWSNFRWR